MFEHLLLSLDKNCLVFNAFRYLIGVVADQINQNRILQLGFREFLYVGRDRRREDHAVNLTFLEVLLDLEDVLLESHVEHLVTFVQDLILHVLQLQALIL